MESFEVKLIGHLRVAVKIKSSPVGELERPAKLLANCVRNPPTSPYHGARISVINMEIGQATRPKAFNTVTLMVIYTQNNTLDQARLHAVVTGGHLEFAYYNQYPGPGRTEFRVPSPSGTC